MNKEEKVNLFVEKLFNEKEPDYTRLADDKELVEIAEISLLLKSNKKIIDGSFEKNLKKSLFKEYRKLYTERSHKNKVAYNILSLGVAISVLFLMLNPFAFGTKHNAHIKINKTLSFKLAYNRKDDIVKIESYRLSNRRTLRILYNERNNAILYWPFGQFAILQ